MKFGSGSQRNVTITDMVGQAVRVKSLVVVPQMGQLATGRVVSLEPLIATILLDETDRTIRRKPWHVMVYGKEIGGRYNSLVPNKWDAEGAKVWGT